MLEWHAVAARELAGCFARRDAPDSWRTLFCGLEMFRRLARQIVSALGFTYEAQLDENMTRLLQSWHEIETA